MSIDYIKNSLQYEAAKMRFDKLDIKAVKASFDALMKQGIWHDEFLGIEYPETNTNADFLPAFESALKKLDIEVPANKDTAVWIILRKNIFNIASGKFDPIIALEQLIKDAYSNYDFHSKTKNYLGDSHGIERLIGAYWEYDDMLSVHLHLYDKEKYDKNLEELKKVIIDTSQEWLKQYGQ